MSTRNTMAGVMIAGTIAATVPASAQQAERLSAFLSARGDLMNLARELTLDIYGPQVCKIGQIVPKADGETVGAAIKLADAKALEAGTALGIAQVRGLDPKPGSPVCRELATAVARNAVGWTELAKGIRVVLGR